MLSNRDARLWLIAILKVDIVDLKLAERVLEGNKFDHPPLRGGFVFVFVYLLTRNDYK